MTWPPIGIKLIKKAVSKSKSSPTETQLVHSQAAAVTKFVNPWKAISSGINVAVDAETANCLPGLVSAILATRGYDINQPLNVKFVEIANKIKGRFNM